ncbi:unnamed protein product [Paramecium primaurelia]|uniref:WD40-repeat-containing domain n=1 Tax=Paramecium primaurelia TaxID=5886 RepID=A0A8S1PN68_PARPR|nr:unnamed protein product [Paramecium primaurelia]
MVEKIPSFQELVINFENKSFLLALSNCSSQVYKIYLNWQSKTLLFYFCIKGKLFGDITSLFSVLDSFFSFQQSECLLIYSKQGDSLDDDLIEENSNNLISSYLKNQNKKSIGLNLITQIQFKIQPNLEKFFSFLENPKKEFDLKFNALFENGFEFKSEKYKYNAKQFQGSLYFYLQGIQQQINFKIYLSLKYVTQNWGELNFQGEVNGSQITSFKGGLELEYKNAFGVNDWDINFSTQITTEIKGFAAELRLNLSNFKPVGLGIMLQNINLRKILRFFNLEEKIPSEFLNYIPNIQKLGVIFGEMPDDYKKSILPEKLYNLVNSKSIIDQLIERIAGQNLEQKYFLIQSSSDSKQFIFDLALYQSAIGRKFFCKGHLKVDISPHLLIEISLETTFNQDQFQFDGKGSITILEENQLDISAHFKPNQFAFQLAIMIQNLKFELGLEAKFENNIQINANIEYDIQKNKGWQQQTYCFFKYIEVKQIVLRLEIDEQQIKCKLKYSIKIVDFKQFEGDFEISFDISVIQNLISLTFERFAQFFSCLPGFNQKTDNLQFKKMLNKNANKIKNFCKDVMNTDVSEELDALREQFDEEDNHLIEPKSHNSQTQNPQNPKPSQQNKNKQRQPSSSPSPPKASLSKQHQKSPQKNENSQSSSSPSSVPPQKTQLPPPFQPPPIKTTTPIQLIQLPPSTQPQQQEFKEKTDKEQNSKKNQNKNDILRFFQNLNEQEIKKKNNNPQQQNGQDEPIQKSLQIEKQESVKSNPANEKNDPENEKNQESCSIIDLDMIKSLKNWSFDEDLKACNVSKQLMQDTKILSKQQPRGLSINGEPKIQQYDQLLSSAEAEIAFEWKNQEQKDIVSMNGRLIISNQTYTESLLLQLGHLLIKLQFLHQKFDIILSGNCNPVFLKNQDIPLSINLIDKIFHGLYGQFNEKLIPVDLNNKQLNDFIIVFTENKLTISDQCKKELISDEIKIVYIFEKAKIFILDAKSGEINEVSISLLEILGEISQQKKKLNQSKIKQTINTREIENLDIQDISHLNIKEANNLKSLLEISKYTKYSLSSKGTTIDIKGIIKFFCTNGTAKDIMKKKNKGGKSLYVFQVVLDMNSFSRACLINVIIPFVYQLIEFCKECKIICNLHIYSDPIIVVKQNFSTFWSQQEQQQLLNSITNFNDNIQIEYNCNQLRFVSDNLTKFNSYKKYLIFINHQLYNYSYQDLSIFINQTQQQQIKLVSIGVDINKQTNRLMEGIFHFPLIESNDLYQIMNDLFEKKIQQDLRIKKFEFKIDNQKFPNQVELEQFQSNGSKCNQYLNRFFNYVSKNDQNQNNEITQIQKQQKFSYELIQNKSITQVNECSAIAINKDSTIIIAGCSNQIRVFEFKQDQLKETQLLSQHEGKVNTLNFMKLSTQFVSGSLDKQIIIWIMNPGNQWVCQQQLIQHSDQIRCLVLNNNEDLIISGSNDMKIKFWKQYSMVLQINYRRSQRKCIGFEYKLTIEQSNFMRIGIINIDN